MRGSSIAVDPNWRLRLRTAHAMVLLCAARALVAGVPFRWWRGSLGLAASGAEPSRAAIDEARRLAVHVHRAAGRLPGTTKCLPQAMALSALLRRARIPHALVMAARPASFTEPGDRLHAWIETGGERVLGDLPNPWIVTLRLEGSAS